MLAIRDGGHPPCGHVTELLGQHLADAEHRIAELATTRATLRELTRTASRTDPATCTESDICRILAADRPGAQGPVGVNGTTVTGGSLRTQTGQSPTFEELDDAVHPSRGRACDHRPH